MNLYLLRHAIAEEPAENQPDNERGLTPKGRQKCQRALHGLASLELKVDLILTSPYLRAQQTAELAAEAFSISKKEIVVSEHLAPLSFADRLIEQINDLSPAGNILGVGHEPYLSQLISTLTVGEPGLYITMKKSGICKLSVEKLAYGRCATLEWLLTPAQMNKM